MIDGGLVRPAHTTGGNEVAKFTISQMVKVIDQHSPHHDLVGSVIVVTPGNGGFFYWLRFGSSPDGGRFGEEQLQATASGANS
jgi:hypothetical protein